MIDEALDERRRRAAGNQSLFREVNEQIQKMQQRFGPRDGYEEFVCECLDTSCSERVELTPDEYERVRSAGDRFVVATGHGYADVEQVVDATARYEIVEKFGAGGAVAAELDPRSAR